MRKILPFVLAVIVITSCKKTEYEPLGPTDVRIYNDTDIGFTDVVVNTSGGEYNFGAVAPKSYSEYHRFEKSYPKVDVSLVINAESFSTAKQDYTYQNYLGQVKCTYKVFIADQSQHLLDVKVVIESPL